MNYKLNKSAIDRVLRRANAEPEELLEWFEWAVKDINETPCDTRTFKGYSFVGGHFNDEYLYNDVINFAGISRDFYACLDFLDYCRKDNKYLKELITEYKQRYNLT